MVERVAPLVIVRRLTGRHLVHSASVVHGRQGPNEMRVGVGDSEVVEAATRYGAEVTLLLDRQEHQLLGDIRKRRRFDDDVKLA